MGQCFEKSSHKCVEAINIRNAFLSLFNWAVLQFVKRVYYPLFATTNRPNIEQINNKIHFVFIELIETGSHLYCTHVLRV